MADPETKLVAALVAANRILSNEGILDVFGHISVRSERNPQEFLLSCSRAPATVAARDIQRYRLDGTPVTSSRTTPYIERVIHSAIYQARPDVRAVCHGHSDGVLPFAATGQAIRPVVHAGALFWNGVGWFDRYDAGGNLLVASAAEGRALAEELGTRRAVVLRNHGFVVAGASLAETVLAAIYLDKNASVQDQASRLGAVLYVEAEEARRAAKVFESAAVQERAWNYWLSRLPRGWQKEAGLPPSAVATSRSSGGMTTPPRNARTPRRGATAKRSGAAQR